jgi:hypothetical protein
MAMAEESLFQDAADTNANSWYTVRPVGIEMQAVRLELLRHLVSLDRVDGDVPWQGSSFKL